MEAMQVQIARETSDKPTLSTYQPPQPVPGKGELLIRVHAAGVTVTELGWYPTSHTKSGAPRLHAIPGHEFSGVVAALGEATEGFTIGQQVYGMNDWFADGATAEFCLTEPHNIALKPATLTYEESATVPIGALTAWQGLFDRAKLHPGERVLVHGGSGGVGLFAVQLAHHHKAHVISTASTENLAFVSQLGADQVIDYSNSRFENLVHDIDVVFDTVGGRTRDLSWPLLKPNGRMISIAADGEGSSDQRVKDIYFIVEPNQKQLIEVARLLDAGLLKTYVKAAVPLSDAASAYDGSALQKLPYGKTVITIP
jgi:NADPH:quinone reductase-like Zn-dependent oxidoreductase